MAYSLSQLRNLIITSIYGRRLGLDVNENIIGPKVLKRPVAAGTSDTTGTNLPNYGYSSVVTTTDDTWVLDNPYVGAEVTLMTGSSSTGLHQINLGGSVCYSTQGIAGSTVVLTGMGGSITLLGISTAIWQVIGRAGSSASNYVSS